MLMEYYSEICKALKSEEKIPEKLIAAYLGSVYPSSQIFEEYEEGFYYDYESFCEGAYDVYRNYALKWCFCGSPEESNRTLYRFLLSRPGCFSSDDWDRANECLKKYFGVDAVYESDVLLCLTYAIDGAGLTNHGSSIFSSRLTPDGELCKYLLEHFIDNEN